MNNRATDEIKAGMEKGENFFILHGKYIHDNFLNDFVTGICGLKDIFAQFFLNENEFKYFAYCKNNVFSVYKLSSGKPIDCTNQLFSAKKTGALAGMSNKADNDDDRDDSVEDAVNNSATHSVEYNNFLKCVKYAGEHPSERIAFFFEDYEWTLGLYKSSNDDQLTYMEKLFDIIKLKNTVVLVSISNAEMLKRYNVDISGKNTIMPGSPAKDEIFRSYLRIYLRKYSKSEIGIDDFTELRYISEAIASGAKTLTNSVQVFERVMKKTKGKINHDDFSDALDKAIKEKVTLDEVILGDDIKERICRQVDDFLDGKQGAKGFILTGPPGTGKTYLVKALANEKNCFFLSPSLAELKGEYVGHTSAKVKRVFDTARANAPTILFIDEADTVFSKRDSTLDSDSFTHDMVNQFLVEMDGLNSADSKVFVIAATNRINMLDNAIKSRLASNPIEIPLPDKMQRMELFDQMLKKQGMENFRNFRFVDEFLDKTERMSGRDIKTFVTTNLVNTAYQQTRTLDSFIDEAETKKLFYDTLTVFEDTFVRDLSAELNIDIIKPDKNSRRYDDIIGCDEIKSVIGRQIDMLDPNKFRSAKNYFKPRKGILLYGPPGNGKSHIAEAAAGQYELYFIKVTRSVLSFGDPAQILIKIFNGAVQLSKMSTNGVVLFFDEFDEFASKYNPISQMLRGTLLTQLDDERTMRNSDTKLLFIAATNFYDRLDDAIIRDGRIDDKLKVDNPIQNDGIKMIGRFIGNKSKYVEQPDYEICSYAYKVCKAYCEYNQQRVSDNEKGEHAEFFPSSSAIKTFVERLIEEAYYQHRNVGNDNKLQISKKTIDALSRQLGVFVNCEETV